MRFVAFDLEIAKPIVDGSNWIDQRPLGISCASAYTSDGRLQLWPNGLDPEGVYPDCMSPGKVRSIVRYLETKVNDGYYIVTWNGLGFDFDVLAEECDSASWGRRVADLAMGQHIDPGFEMVCQKGYMVGLQKAAESLEVAGKTAGMHGDLAPLLWTGDLTTMTNDQKQAIIDLVGGTAHVGNRKAQELCLEYVGQDSKATMAVYQGLAQQKELWWVTNKGTICRYPWRPRMKGDRLLTVEEAMRLDIPDTSWMSDPRPRHTFYDWVKRLRERKVTL